MGKNLLTDKNDEEIKVTQDTTNKLYKLKRTKKSSLLNSKLLALKAVLIKGRINSFEESLKHPRGIRGQKSKRRSYFIGVSKNSFKWQALINFKNKKKYIGTFLTQEEAARAYDLYAMAFQGVKAKLNHSYSREEALSFINFNLETGRFI